MHPVPQGQAPDLEYTLFEPQAPVGAGELLVPGYRVVEHLSRGERLDVYEVYSLERNCGCVAKAIRPDYRTHERACRRLRQEGELLARLTHPHLVRAYETIEHPQLVVILETVSGRRLDDEIECRRRRLPAVEVAYLGHHIASATHYLHRHGFLHLDLKPENIVCEAGRAKLLDLSLAQPPGPATAGIGTRPYLAPEQAKGETLTPATDVWGIGAVLYEAATASPPFVDSDGRYPQLYAKAPSVHGRRRLPSPLAQTIDACLAISPQDRPDCASLTTVFERIASQLDNG